MKRKDIIQLVKKLVKEDAYGSATLTTQGAPRTRAVVPAGKDEYTGRVEYPYTVGAKTKNGMMEEEHTAKDQWSEFSDEEKAGVLDVLGKDGDIILKNYSEYDEILDNIMKGDSETFDAAILDTLLNEEGASWGLDIRKLADSFTFDELEQIKNDGKIEPEDYNGAVGYLQAWIDQHPNYLKQRDFDDENSFGYETRKALRDKYLNEEEVHGKEIVITAGSLQNALTFIGKNLKKLSGSMLSRLLGILKLSNISDFPYNVKDLKLKLKQLTPEEAKTFGLELNKFHTDMKRKNIKQEATAVRLKTNSGEEVTKNFGSLGDAQKFASDATNFKNTVEPYKENEGGAQQKDKVSEEEAPGTSMSNADIGTLNDLVQLYRPEKLKATIDILAKGTTLTSKFTKKYEEMDINEMINDYIKERGDDNLKEHVNKYHKRSQLMEGAIDKIFKLYKSGLTPEQVRGHYFDNYKIDMPIAFAEKVENHYNDLRKSKLDLQILDKEAESLERIQPKAIAGMEDGDVGMEEDKQLTSGLFNETK